LNLNHRSIFLGTVSFRPQHQLLWSIHCTDIDKLGPACPACFGEKTANIFLRVLAFWWAELRKPNVFVDGRKKKDSTANIFPAGFSLGREEFVGRPG